MVKCSICGKYITENFTWDHVYPRELSKWTNNVKVKKLIKSKYNRAPAHYKCNYRKQDLTPNVDKLHISNEQKNQLKSIYKKIEVYIELHKEEKASLASRLFVLQKEQNSKLRIWIVLSMYNLSKQTVCVHKQWLAQILSRLVRDTLRPDEKAEIYI